VIEQPPSAIAANAIAAFARGPRRKLAEKTPVIGTIIVQDTQALTLLLVTCPVMKCIGEIAVRTPSPRHANNNAGLMARVNEFMFESLVD